MMVIMYISWTKRDSLRYKGLILGRFLDIIGEISGAMPPPNHSGEPAIATDKNVVLKV